MIVSGPVWSGKTSFVVRLIDSCKQTFDVVPTRVYWCYGQKTDDHEMLTKKNFTMIDGVPENFDFAEPNSIVVLDDLMSEAKAHAGVTALYTKIAHHRPLFVITMLQNFYIQSREMRNRHLNSQYIVLFKAPRDQTQIDILGRQMYPSKKHFLMKIFQDATLNQHAYLFIDLNQQTSELIRLRTNVLPSEKPMYCYVDKQLYAKVHTLNR